MRSITPLPAISLVLTGCLLCSCGDSPQGTQVDDLTAATCKAELDLAPLELNEQLCVVAELANVPPAAAFALTGNQLWLYGPDDDATSFSVTTHELDLVEGSVADNGVEALAVSAKLDPGVTAFPGGFLALAPDRTPAVGYTRDSDFGGSVIVAADGQSFTDLDAPGNYDADWLDEDTLLVNGQGLGDGEPQQGLYAWQRGSDTPQQLVDNLGSASSFVARNESVVFVGESAWPSNKLYAFTVEELQQALAAGKTLDAQTDGDLVYEGEIIDATAMSNGLVVLETTFDDNFTPHFGAVRRIGVTVDGASVSATEDEELIGPGAGGSRPTALAAFADLLALRLEQVSGDSPVVIVKAK